MHGDVVIVGGGECAGRTAMALRDHGWTGAVTIVGDEAEAPYERPPLSKEALTDVPEPAPRTVATVDRLAEAGITFLAGASATTLDRTAREVALADGRTLAYDRLVLATGARPRPLPVPGGERALLLRSFHDACTLRHHLAPRARVGIVGAGFIGLEVAASAATRGCQVTVVEIAPQVMGRAVPPSLAEVVADRHRAAGVDLRCGVGIDEVVAGADGHLTMVLGDGSTVACDVVVAGIGVVPNTALAELAGLTVDNGIAVDDRLTTDDALVLAAGDCCSFPHALYGGRRIRLEAWRNAVDQAEHAARVLHGADVAFAAVPWFWSDQYELVLQVAGLPDEAIQEVPRARSDGAVVRFGLDAGGRLVSAAGVGPGGAIARDIKVAERLIAARGAPDPAVLADPDANLRSLLS